VSYIFIVAQRWPVFSTVLARNFLAFLGDFHSVDSHLAIYFLSCANWIVWGTFSNVPILSAPLNPKLSLALTALLFCLNQDFQDWEIYRIFFSLLVRTPPLFNRQAI
jgi:hypothetical protein